MMQRFYAKYSKMSNYEKTVCPRWFMRIEKAMLDSRSYAVVPNSQGRRFEVDNMHRERFQIDLDERTCSCGKWDLTGIPCSHAAAACVKLNISAHDFVEEWYHKEKFLRIYHEGILPVPDERE